MSISVVPPMIEPEAEPPPLLRSRSVLLYLGGQFISLLGDRVFYIALAWTLAAVSDGTTAGLVLAAGALPRAVLLLGGGVLVDRMGPLKAVVSSDVVRFAVMLLVSGYLVIARPNVGLLLAVAVIFGVAEALFHPALAALPPRMAPQQQLVQLQGFRALVNRGANVLGAPLGGLLLISSGPALAFFINAVTFAISVVTLLGIQLLPASAAPQQEPAEPVASGSLHRFGQELTAGLRYARGNATILHVLIVAFLIEFGFTGTFNVALPLAAQARGWRATDLGLILGVFSLGAVCAAMVTAAKRRLRLGGWTLIVGASVSAISIAWIGFSAHPVAALPAAFLIGIGAAVMTTVVVVLLQTSAPGHMLGRTMSLMTLVSYGSQPIAYAIAGIMTDHWGSRAAFLFGAIFTLGAACVGASSKPLRRAILPT